MPIFDKGSIANFSKSVENDVVLEGLNKTEQIITSALQDIKKRSAFVSSEVDFLLVNEFFCQAIIPNSNIDIFLILDNSQLEFNTSKIIKHKLKNFWERLKMAWKNRKVAKKKKNRKKDKYLNNEIEDIKLSQYDKENYNMYSFDKDLIISISNYITPSSYVSLNDGMVKIVGADIPFNVNIYPVINKHGSYNYYSFKKNKFINIDFNKRFENLQYMIDNYGENFLSLYRILGGLYFSLYNQSANSLFLESLLINLPSETYFKKDIYEVFQFAINYFRNCSFQNFISCTQSAKMIKDELCGMSPSKIIKFIEDIAKYTKY